MEDVNATHTPKFLLVWILSLVHFISVATSFEISFPWKSPRTGSQSKVPTNQIITTAKKEWSRQQLLPHAAPFWISRASRAPLLSSSVSSPEPSDSDESSNSFNTETTADAAYNDLYEFLTQKQGDSESTERKRKRDRIKDFMSSSNSASSNNSVNSGEGKQLIQPIRLEDGKVDTELVDQQRDEQRMKVRFDTLFSGMPTLEEIISRGPEEEQQHQQESQRTMVSKKKRTSDDDFSWFEPERLRIEKEYEQLLQETKAKIQEQRRLEEAQESQQTAGPYGTEINALKSEEEIAMAKDPSIPNNAESIVDAIVTQEMNRMIDSVRIERAKQRLQAYESEQSSNLQENNEASEEVVDKIFKDTAQEWERNEKLQAGVDAYQEYERQKLQEAALQEAQEGNIPNDATNLDDWTLDRLEEMLEKSENLEDVDAAIIDSLEENIDELRRQIERESKKGAIEPQSMKEWQMYQAIATRLTEQQKTQQQDRSDNDAFDQILTGETVDGIEGRVDEVQLSQQLDSWREYIDKEDQLRQGMGLGSDYDLPFGHLGTKIDRIQNIEEENSLDDSDSKASLWGTSEVESKEKSRREMRRDVNIQAIEAMENLIGKSDSRRAAFLQQQLDSIKSELEESDYYDIEEEVEEPVPLEPVDLTGVFNQDKADGSAEKESKLSAEEMDGVNQILSFSGSGAQYSGKPAPKPEPPDTPFFRENTPQPPNTPFFQDDDYDDEYESSEPTAPVPNTPFFQDREDITEDEVVDVDNKLGSVDEQKLQRMFRKGNVRSIAEQDTIRQNWEDYQAYEKSIRDKAGLSKGLGNDEDESSSLTDGVELQYNVDDVMTGDGDIDAEKVLSTIGPRPTKKGKGSESASAVSEATPPPPPIERKNLSSSVASSEVADAIYRSVSASGGIGKEDKAVRDKDKADYQAYLEKEEEMKVDLEDLEEDIDEVVAEVGSVVDIDVEDPDYVDEVLPSRPIWKRKKKKEEMKFSGKGEMSMDTQYRDDSTERTGGDDLVPDWLKAEQKAAGRNEGGGIGGAFLGGNIGGSSMDDDYDRQLEEYKRSRAEEQGRMGINIMDALGRRGSDDSRDYTFDNRPKRTGWGAASFEARKANLLGYIELDPSELNNLMAYKDSEFSTGASQYLPRINKPFKEFGAIFRLEGVLIDITGLQQRVWNRVAAEFELREPLLEDVKRAAVLKPEDAVRELFFTVMGDFVMVRKIVDSYRQNLRLEFDAWASAEGLSVKTALEPKKPIRGSLALGFEDEVQGEESSFQQDLQTTMLPLDEGKRLRYLQEVWRKTANQFGFQEPTNEQIAESSLVTPDIAVSSIFCWAQEQMQINKIVSAFSILQAGGSVPIDDDIPQTEIVPNDRPLKPEEVTEEMILELQYMAWEEVAEENDFDELDPEEVLAAASINNPEVIILEGFEWTYDPVEAAELASSYREYFTQFVNEYIHKRPYTRKSVESSPVAAERVQEYAPPTMPTEEEILSSQTEAWKETAEEFGFDPPQIDQIRSVADLSPEAAVRKVISMNYNIEECSPDEVAEFEAALPEIVETYRISLAKFSQQYTEKYETATEQPTSPVVGSSQEVKTVSQDEIYCASFDAWTHVAWKNGFPLPVQDEVEFAFTVGPKEAVLGGFGWAETDDEAEEIVQQYLDQIKVKRDEWIQQGYVMTEEPATNNAKEENIPLVSTMPGVLEWVQSLQAVEIGCGVVTHLEKDQMQILLDYSGLSELFPEGNQVSNSNGYLRDNQQLLGVSLRIERRPDHCVIFDTSPLATVGAHEYEMRSVALIGPYPRYELISADTTAASVDELNAASIRRLFGERINDQPMLDTENSNPLDAGKKVQTKTQFAGDE